jgi:type II secretory pathway component PulF
MRRKALMLLGVFVLLAITVVPAFATMGNWTVMTTPWWYCC